MAGRTSARRGTSTSNFGVGKRENHDSTGFYERFGAPALSDDDTISVLGVDDVDRIWTHDARDMGSIPDNSVALVVTSPPYFAGKAYEEALGEGHIPADYVEYLDMLHDVFAECARVLEPGGRIAVNVANLGRKPYRSLSADVIHLLQDRLGLLLRGEIIWQKARGAGGNCAWGSFASPTNPVLRDLTERIVVASKGRFDRARSASKRRREGLPATATIGKDDFLDLTLDHWEFPPESATRVGHPAPYPVELPRRLIDLYTFEGDVVLDPFMGSGTTAVAAVRTNRRYVGFEMDPQYAEAARTRIKEAEEQCRTDRALEQEADPGLFVGLPRTAKAGARDLVDFQARASHDGIRAQELAERLLRGSGFGEGLREKVKFPALGVEVNFAGRDTEGQEWLFDVSGAFSSSRPGLQRTDTLWKALGKASVLATGHDAAGERTLRYVLITTDVPERASAGYKALIAAQSHGPIWDVLRLGDPRTVVQLLHYASGRDGERRPDQPTAYR
ncbi:MAG: site-specific DNA-methyltransferase [Acidimicrobiales bacterium]|nr:site-specific DNA-methyltransferase [Acidimicrobiales bacterium]